MKIVFVSNSFVMVIVIIVFPSQVGIQTNCHVVPVESSLGKYQQLLAGMVLISEKQFSCVKSPFMIFEQVNI